jgi:hypothetical protein
MPELPDWLRASVLVGKFGSEYIPIAVDENGNMYILMQGLDGVTLRPVKLDSQGRIIGTLIDPASNNYVAVNASGFLTTILKGLGADAALHTISVDNAGQIIMVPRGASGNYMNVDANGFLSSVMKGNDTGTLRTIAVDASGNIVGVLKGETGAGLQTLKVDSEGRLFAYLQDGIDQWGNILVGGLAELATRLGSSVSYDRRGQVLSMDDFSSGLGNWILDPGTGGIAQLSPATFLRGGYSIKLQPTAFAGEFALAQQSIGALPSGQRVGLSAWIRFEQYPYQTLLEAYLYDGVTTHWPAIMMNGVTHQLLYRNAAAGYTAFGTWDNSVGSKRSFRFFKLVFNPATLHYVRALIDDQQFDLSSAIYQSSSNTDKALYTYVRVITDGTNVGPIYVGAVALTSVEPAN